MNLQQLYYLKTIAETANYTKAADRLFITQSSLSHSISDLEKELGVSLFYKDGRSVALTEYGNIFLSHVTCIIDELENAYREIKLAKDATSGTIKVMLSHTLAQTFSLTLKAFYSHDENSGTVLDIKEGVCQDIMDALRDNKIDLGFSARIAAPDIDAFPVRQVEMVLIVPPDHPWAQRDDLTLSDLDGVPLVLHSPRCGTRHYINSIMKEAGLNLLVALEAETEKMIASLVVASGNVGLVPHESDVGGFDVRVLPLEHGRYRRYIYMLWRNNKELLPYVKNFRDYVIHYCGDEAAGG